MQGKVDIINLSRMNYAECGFIMDDEDFQATVQKQGFQIAVADTNILAVCQILLPYKLGIPWVTVPLSTEMELMRVPSLPSFVPAIHVQRSDKMTFRERLENFVGSIFLNTEFLSPFPGIRDTSLIHKHTKDPNLRSWFALARKTSVFLCQRGYLLEWPEPLMPNVIQLEGLSAKPAREIHGELAPFLESASQGVVVVSMGSSVKYLPTAVTQKMLNAFGKRKETFIFRSTNPDPSISVPENVRLSDWLPQNDILGHKNTRMFITHGGDSGQYEALYHGVPMLTVPLFGEQPHNAMRAEAHGYGLSLKVFDFTEEELLEKMAAILDEPTYRNRIQKGSRILKSRPMNARETAAYWIEHVLEFGDEHLRSHALNMDWYSYYMVDIFAVILAFVLILILFAVFLVCYIIHL